MYVHWLQNSMRKTFEFAHQNLGIAATRQTHYYDKGLKPRSYRIGYFVWRWYPPALACKLGQGWTGPYKVIRKFTDVIYEVQKTPSSTLTSVHVYHLKPYQGASVPTPSADEISISGPCVEDLPDDNSEDNAEAGSSSTPASELIVTRDGRVRRPNEIYSP